MKRAPGTPLAPTVITPLIRDIPIAWGHIREARKLVQDALAAHDAELRDAAAMTMSELIENAVKYGEPVEGMPGARFTMSIGDDVVEIRVQNGSLDTSSLAALRRTVDAIAAAVGPDAREALYVARLQQLMEDTGSGGQLGLYRIGFEGGFDLACSQEGDVVTVTATRRLR